MSATTDKPAMAATLRQAFAGLVISFDNLARTIAVAMLIFSGSLAAGAPWGVTIFLLSAVIGTATLLNRRFFAGPVISNVQNTIVAILMPAIFTISALPASEAVRVSTVFALLGLTAIATGVTMILMAWFNLGRLVRIMPFPVSAGYLAASGALLMVSAISLVCPGSRCVISEFSKADSPAIYAPLLTVSLAIVMALAVRMRQGFGLAAALALSIAGFYAGLGVLGISLDDARAAGLLPPDTIGGAVSMTPFLPASLSLVDWSVLVDVVPLILTAVLVGVFATLLNLTGVELAVKREINTRGELMRAGVINIGTGLAGSTVSFPAASTTYSALLLGARGRMAGSVLVGVLAASAFFSGNLLGFMPLFASAGLLLFFGASILHDWLIRSRYLQSRQEWLLSFFIVLASLLVGMPNAVLLGIVLASLIFALSYARLPIIRRSTSLRITRSTVDRAQAEAEILDSRGDEIALVNLQGFLFFGSIEKIIAHTRALLIRDIPARMVILDFSRVSQMDASAFAALRKLDILAESAGARIVLAGLNTHLAAEMLRGQLLDTTKALSIEPSSEMAIEKAENQILEGVSLCERAQSVLGALERITGHSASARQLFNSMKRMEIPVGTRLVREGELSGDVYILESGALSVFITTAQGARIRVRKQRAGSIFGEIAAYMYMPRTADVEADTDSVVYCMTEQRLSQIEAAQPDLAAHWHKAMARALADKLMRTNKLLGDSAS